MDYSEVGALLFVLAFTLPGLLGVAVLPFIDIRYGNTYLFGAFFDRDLSRDEHPVWFWLIEAIQIAVGFSLLASVWPLLAKTIAAFS